MLDIETKVKQKISKVKAKLVTDQPYFGTIATYFKDLKNNKIQTFNSTFDTFEYNENYILDLSEKELSFILTNASMHQVLSHEIRKENRDDWLWKLSTDFAINLLLINNGFEAPKGINYEERFNNLSSESIYKILETELDKKLYSPEKVSKIKYKEETEVLRISDDEIDLERLLTNRAKLQGDLPLGIDILVPRLNKNIVSWREELFNIIENAVKFDYRLFPANKRYISQGISLPSLGVTKIKIVVAIDTSGSIDKSVLSMFLSEVESIMNTFDNFEIDLLLTDAKVHQHYVLLPGDEIDYNIKGGGGTNFENTYKYIEENITDLKLVLYFTDGIGKYPEENFSYDTLWILTNKDTKVPFGKFIYI